MAGAPPRRESLGSQCGNLLSLSTSTKTRSSLDTLLAMGFPRKRVERAIAATGNKGINFASEWLLSHVNDPTIDQTRPREYVLYLSPKRELLANLNEFWQKSKSLGWNSAHMYQPHITLCPFFKMPDDKVTLIDDVVTMMMAIIQEWKSFDYSLGLDLDTKNSSFIGFFLSRPVHQLIEDLMIRTQLKFKENDVEMELHKKQLHMTLAFQYSMENQERLMELARDILIPTDTQWELRVYSRDAALRTSEVRKILKHYPPVQGDELELCIDDYVLMDPQEHAKSQDGWYKGASYLTGAEGFFPGNFTELTCQMDAWTLHRTVELRFNSRNFANGLQNNSDFLQVQQEKTTESAASSDSEYDSIWVTPSDVYALVNKKNNPEDPATATAPSRPPGPRKMFVVRHGQRCDFNYKNWYLRSFDDKGLYNRFDLNCPPFVLPRQSFKDYSKDAPLTEIGKAQALITGEGLRDAGETIPFIYASPALRCVQTAHQIMKGLNSECQICVEPGLFEWCGWCREGMPSFMTDKELWRAGFPVDQSYVPYLRTGQLDHGESVETYYDRSHNTAQHILKRHLLQKGRILMVGHSGSMDACTRQLTGKPPKVTDIELRDVVRGCPYCFMCSAVEDPATLTWKLCEPPMPQFSHGGNREYDWRSMLD